MRRNKRYEERSWEQEHEYQCACYMAEEYFIDIAKELHSCRYPETPMNKYKALWGLYKSNRPKQALALIKSWYDDYGLQIPEELYGMSARKRWYYLDEFLDYYADFLWENEYV